MMLNPFWITLFFCLYKETLSLITKPNLPDKVIYELDYINILFKEFVHKYDKDYNYEEFEYRRKVFGNNLIKINRLNHEQQGVVYGINPFTDLTYEEFIKTHTGFLGNITNENAIKYEPNGMAPESLDWREKNLVTGIKDQGICSSCYIFSAIGNIEGQHAKQSGQLIELSEQQSLDCYSNGCNGGYPHEVMQALANKGCMSESDYPYNGQPAQCRSDQNKIAVKVTGGSQLAINSEDDLKDALTNYGPLSIGIKTNEDLKHFHGGVFTPTECSGAGHAVLLIGYGTEGSTPYWLIKNSWGQQWNENGYLRMIRGQKACDIGSYVASATVA